MVKYRCDSEDGRSQDRVMGVYGADGNEVVCFTWGDEVGDGVDLSRDSVAALVGQLQSWLARTETRP